MKKIAAQPCFFGNVNIVCDVQTHTSYYDVPLLAIITMNSDSSLAYMVKPRICNLWESSLE